MSSQCRIVAGISVLVLLFGIATIGAAAIMYFGAPSVDRAMEDGALIARVSAAILAVMGVFGVITGILGVRGARDPQRLTPFIVCATIIAFVNLFEVGMAFTGGEGPVWVNILYAVVAFVAIVFASRARNGAERG